MSTGFLIAGIGILVYFGSCYYQFRKFRYEDDAHKDPVPPHGLRNKGSGNKHTNGLTV